MLFRLQRAFLAYCHDDDPNRGPRPSCTPASARALGLALAVLVARLFGLQHAFWVVLGTMSVLRSSALATGRTTVQALAGTLLGFAVGGLFTLLFASDPFALGAALPVAVFLAAYLAASVSFVAGQAAFTVLLILFNLLTPAGWQVGLVRIEDVAVGSAIGMAVGVLLWPRRARSDFADALTRLYRLVAVHLSEALDLVLGQGRVEAVNATRAQVWQAREKTGESFDRQSGAGAIAVAWTGEWLEQLDALVRDLEQPAANVAGSAAAPWWK